MPTTLSEMRSIITFLDEQNVEVSIFRHVADARLAMPEEWAVVLSCRRLGQGPSFSITHRHQSFETALSQAIDDINIYLNVWPKRMTPDRSPEIEQLVTDLLDTELNGHETESTSNG